MPLNSWDYEVHTRYRREDLAKNYHPKRHPARTGNAQFSLRRAAGLQIIALGGWLAGDRGQPTGQPGAASSRG